MAITWPIIVLREADFLWSRVDANGVWWTAIVAATIILGVLWFDALFAEFSETDFPAATFERTVALPMAAGWALSRSVVAIYQLFGDVTFLNRGLWGYMQRARGTFNDANPFGVLSAIWVRSSSRSPSIGGGDGGGWWAWARCRCPGSPSGHPGRDRRCPFAR